MTTLRCAVCDHRLGLVTEELDYNEDHIRHVDRDMVQHGEKNLAYFPSDKVYEEWMKYHRPALQKHNSGQSTTIDRLHNMPKKFQFW